MFWPPMQRLDIGNLADLVLVAPGERSNGQGRGPFALPQPGQGVPAILAIRINFILTKAVIRWMSVQNPA
jgi:hypothetical protein